MSRMLCLLQLHVVYLAIAAIVTVLCGFLVEMNFPEVESLSDLFSRGTLAGLSISCGLRNLSNVKDQILLSLHIPYLIRTLFFFSESATLRVYVRSGPNEEELVLQTNRSGPSWTRFSESIVKTPFFQVC